MATKANARRKALLEAQAREATSFEGVTSWHYDDAMSVRKNELETEAQRLANAVRTLLHEAAAAQDAQERTVLAVAAARRLMEALAFVAPYTGLDLPEIIRG